MCSVKTAQLFRGLLFAFLCWTSPSSGQPLGPIVKIPIEKVREFYNNPSEDGKGKSCGVKLYGEWAPYRNYTNRTSYTIFTPGLQSIPSPQNFVKTGERFRFYCYFNGVATPFNDAECPTKIGEDLPDWYVEVRRRGPTAAFTYRKLPPEAGQFEFSSTSTDPEDELLIESWNFGDGESSGGAGPIHRYTKPGNFQVRLTVKDTDALTNMAVRTVTVPAPKPSVSIRLLSKHSGNRIEIDEEFIVRITVAASDDGVGSLSQLAFTGPALSAPALFSIVQAPGQTTINTLQPGDQQEFDWRLRANQAGQFTLTAAGVLGKDAIDRAVSGASDSLRGEVTALIAGIEQVPSRVIIGGDNNRDGVTNELDRLVHLIVGITNVSRQNVTEVKSVIVDDPIQLTSLAQDLNIWLTPTNVPPGDFGTILPGAANAIRRTNTYVASDRTYAEAAILLQGKVGDTGVQTRGEGLVNIGGETLVEARFDIEDRPYKAGQVVRVFGSLKNISRFRDSRGGIIDEGRTVGVVIYPTVEGNGLGGFPFLKDSGGRTPDGPTAFMIKPDETIDLSAIIPTAEVITNTPLSVTYAVVGYVHGEGPKPRRARPGEIEVIEKVTEGWSAHHELELTGVPEMKDPWLVCPTELSFGGFVSCRFSEGLFNAGGGLVGMGMLTATGLGEIGMGSIRMIGWGLWACEQAFKGLKDPAAQARLAEEIAVDVQALQQVGVESLDGVILGVKGIGPALERAIIDTGRVLESGDLKQIAGGMARITGENIDVPLEALVAARAVRKALLVKEGAESAAQQALKESLERQTRELGGTVDDYAARGELSKLPESDDLPTGINVVDEPRVYRDAYGARKEDVDGVLAVAKEEGVILAFRSRAAKAAQYLKAKTHLLKPGGVSIKTVSEIDRKYLGFPDIFDAECALVEPPIPWISPSSPHYIDLANDYLNRFPELNLGTDASTALRSEVYQRLKFQMEQYPEQAANFIKYAREGIDVNFHAQKQGVGLGKYLLPNKEARRAARLEQHLFNDPLTGNPRVAYRLLMDDGAGVFKPITGDIDFLAILNPDGTMPSLLKRLRVYKKMVALGMQHGESFTFFKKELREKFLRCCSPKIGGGDGEKMLAATPYGELLTTIFRDSLSVIEGGPNTALQVGKGEFSFLEGALTEVNTLERTAADALPKAVRQEIAPLVTTSALARMVDDLEIEADRSSGKAVRMGADGQPEIYDPAPASPPPPLPATYRLTGPQLAGEDPTVDALLRTLDQLSAAGWSNERKVSPAGAAGGQWRPVTVAEARGGSNGNALRLSPYTYITGDIPAGSQVLPTLSSTEIGFPSKHPLFAVGDRIVIDPGGTQEEFATVASVYPLTLTQPLENLQEAGTMVLFLSGIADPTKTPGALPAQANLLVWLRADAGVQLDGTNVVSWTDQSANGFVFQSPANNTRPVWIANSTSGVPAIRFNASSTPRLQGNLGRSLSNATIFTVARYLNNSSSSRYIYAFGTINFSGLMMTLARTGTDDATHYDGAATWVGPNSIPGTGFRVYSQVFGEDGADRHRLAVDGRTVIESRTTVGRPYSVSATNVILGKYLTSTLGFGGDLEEWLVYDRVLTPEERRDVEEYLRQRARLAPFYTPGSIDLRAAETVNYDIGPDPSAVWQADAAGLAALVTNSADPSFLLDQDTLSGGEIRARLRSEGTAGFIGFTFGWQDRGHFLLFDWNRTATNHPTDGFAPVGMRLREFHMPVDQMPTGADFWSSSDPSHVSLLSTNNVPWQPGVDYDLVIRLLSDRAELQVFRGTTNLANWAFPQLTGLSGSYGFYANHAPTARVGGLARIGAPPIIKAIHAESGAATLTWRYGLPPYVVEGSTNVTGDWFDVAPATFNASRSVMITNPPAFLRVRGAETTP